MSTAENIAPMPWGEICRCYPNEWVCLADVQRESGGLIRSARLVAHHCSIKQALLLSGVSVDSAVVHTGARR